MKTWKKAEIVSLNVDETANGWFDTEVEFWPLVNDSLGRSSVQPGEQPGETPSTPSTGDDVINSRS